MINNNGIQPRTFPLATSPPPFNPQNQEQFRAKPVIPFKTYETYQKPNVSKVEPVHSNLYNRTPASHSLSSNPKPTINKQGGFNRLDSMARNTVTHHNEDSVNELPSKLNSISLKQENIAQSMIGHSNPFNRFFGSNRNQQRQQDNDDIEPVRKRRESIDIGTTARGDRIQEPLPFLRRTQDPKDSKQSKQTKEQNPQQKAEQRQQYKAIEKPTQRQNQKIYTESSKQNLFQFLKKRKDGLSAEMSLSMIVAPQSSHNGKTGKQQHPFGYRKPDFIPSNFKSTTQIKTQDEGAVFDSPKRPASNSFNFEFKKKRGNESIEQAVGSTVESPSKQLLNRRRNLPQREIKLSDFQLLDKLGKGAFGQVFMAQQKNIGVICVIKKMSKQRIRETRVEQHILREIKIQSYLNHAGLTALYGYFHDEDFLYLVLEALPDGSLQQVKKRRKLPEKQTAAIVKQVSLGLKYMHEEYIIHRDLKPQNLFVNDGLIKLGDFGCSIYNRDLATRNTVVGCLEYSSPEQLSKQGYTDKIDSWSLGILTYQLLFGKSPFESEIIKISRNKEQKAELNGLVFPASTPVSADTRNFIQNLLSEDPEQRMEMDQVLQHPFLREEMSKKPLTLEGLQGFG